MLPAGVVFFFKLKCANRSTIDPKVGLLVVRLRILHFANINGFSMMVFIILMALLTHGHGMSFQDRCLGFPKRPCFPKFMKMVAHGAPVTDGLDEFRSLRSEDTKRYKNLE